MAARDATLVLGVLNGDRSPFAELYDRRARLIRAVCYDESRDVHTAADLTQEVFLRAYRKLGKLNGQDWFAAGPAGMARQERCQPVSAPNSHGSPQIRARALY